MPSYYSQFVLNLIDEVKKREILYNTRYEKRPKAEKQEAWNDIAVCLEESKEKCQKVWKNVRDRFVKVMHERDKHFHLGGTELTAPHYIYYEKLLFIREFSIIKDPPKKELFDNEETVLNIEDISPMLLTKEEGTDSEGTVTLVDYTQRFLELVKDNPMFYDENASYRRYRGPQAWGHIAAELGIGFSRGLLRRHWCTLMRKYKFYLGHHEVLSGKIDNEWIFDEMSFIKVTLSKLDYDEDCTAVHNIVNSEDEMEDEEHLIEDVTYECDAIEPVVQEDVEEQRFEDACIESSESVDESSEPQEKKPKIRIEKEHQLPIIYTIDQISGETSQQDQIHSMPFQVAPTAIASQSEDQFDLFGKKVALQLREISRKNRNAARKGEIKVLELLMGIEEDLEDK